MGRSPEGNEVGALQENRLDGILDAMAGRRALVVGDVMLDEYVWGKVRRISPEAPVMVVEVERDSYTPGGAGNVVNNVQALGGLSSIVGVVGDDDAGRALASCLRETGVDVSGLVTDASRPTTRKTRIIAHSQQVVRVDREDRKRLSRHAIAQVVSSLADVLPSVDIIVFSDYDKGMAGREIIKAVLGLAKNHGKRTIVNPKPGNLRRFKSASVISVNQSEAEAASGVAITDEKSLYRAAKRLVNTLQPEALIITRGPAGMSIFDTNADADHIPAHLVEVYDVAGAGDTVVSALALALAAGATIREAAAISNCAGSAVVRKVGVATVTRDEIRNLLNDKRSAPR